MNLKTMFSTALCVGILASGHTQTSQNASTSNTFVGYKSGSHGASKQNTSVGALAGKIKGNNNVTIGYGAGGGTTTGNGNVLIGHNAAWTETIINDQLYISNSLSPTPLIWGDFNATKIKLNGKTGIGFGPKTTFPSNSLYNNYSLFVAGGILTDELRVKLRANGLWADYVFKPDYKLPTLDEVALHIKEKGHLINVPSASQIQADGFDIAEMATIQQEKIEELTLYAIEQHKVNNQQAAEIAALKVLVQTLLDKK